jgi:hypothetical protein
MFIGFIKYITQGYSINPINPTNIINSINPYKLYKLYNLYKPYKPNLGLNLALLLLNTCRPLSMPLRIASCLSIER